MMGCQHDYHHKPFITRKKGSSDHSQFVSSQGLTPLHGNGLDISKGIF